MIGYFYFIKDKYKKVLNVNDKKEIELNEIKIISEENENLLDKKKNDVIDIRVIYKKLLNYIF
jgi:CRISPR/Cas system-associated endonuclease Cas3-HD